MESYSDNSENSYDIGYRNREDGWPIQLTGSMRAFLVHKGFSFTPYLLPNRMRSQTAGQGDPRTNILCFFSSSSDHCHAQDDIGGHEENNIKQAKNQFKQAVKAETRSQRIKTVRTWFQHGIHRRCEVRKKEREQKNVGF